MESAPQGLDRPRADLSFMEVAAIENLREQQAEIASKVREQILSTHTTTEIFTDNAAIEQSISTEINDISQTAYRKYLDDHLDQDTDPKLYNRLLDLLDRTSITRMDNEQWYLGPQDTDGNHTNGEDSGRTLVEKTLADIRGDTEPQPEPPLSAEERKAAFEAVKITRNKLAGLSIKRRQMIAKRSDKAYALEAEYLSAQNEYKSAIKIAGTIKAKEWRDAGLDENELRANVITALLDEHQAFSQAEQEVMESDNSRKARIARWLASKHRLTLMNAGTGIAVGFGVKWGIRGAAGAALGIAAPAALGLGAAIKTTKGVLAATVGNKADTYRHFDKRYKEDRTALHEQAHGELAGDDHETLVVNASKLLQGTLERRIEKDRKYNRNRVLRAAVIGGVAGAAAIGAEVALDHAHVLGSHTVSSKPSHPGKGSSGGPHSGNGSGGNTGGSAPQTQSPSTPKPGVVDGYQTHVHIAQGEGYQQALNELAAQKHIHLSDAQSWQLYEHLNDKFHGSFFTNDPSYKMGNAGQWGISHAGAAHWNPAVIHEMNRWMLENEHHEKITKAAKVTKKAAKLALARH